MTVFSESVSSVLFGHRPLDRLVSVTVQRWRHLAASLSDPYRPELHYMRGPGPKWREKYARDSS
jgi:hypothetical protein